MPGFSHRGTIPKEFCLAEEPQSSWAAVPHKEQCHTRSSVWGRTSNHFVLKLSARAKVSTMVNADTPVCWQRLHSATRAHNNIYSLDYRFQGPLPEGLQQLLTLLYVTKELYLTRGLPLTNHCPAHRRLNLWPADSAPRPLSLCGHFHDFWKQSAFRECDSSWTSAPDRFYQPTPGVPFAFRWNSELLLNSIEQEALSPFPKRNEHSGRQFFLLYSRVLQTDTGTDCKSKKEA